MSGAPLTPPQRVLVVEDEPHLAALVEGSLAAGGYEVEVAGNGADAVAKAATLRPAAVVVDLDLLAPSGIDVCRRLRSDVATATTAIVVLSDARRPDDVAASFAAGADDYVAKPFAPTELLDRVEAGLRRQGQRRSVSPYTGLPGHFEVVAQLDPLVSEEPQRFALVHVDLDDFAGYNRRHGIPVGDEAITVTAGILRAAVEGLSASPRLVGHAGGDDFLVLTAPDVAEELAAKVVAAFGAAESRPPGRADRPGFAGVRLDGGVRLVPRLSVSLGVATSAHRRFASASEVTAVAAEMLGAAKARSGSAWYVGGGWAASEVGRTARRLRPARAESSVADADYLSTAEVAAILHVSARSVARWAQEGRLPHVVTLGGHRRFPRGEIERRMGLL